MKRNVTFLHASPAAVAPLMNYYSGAAPDLEITNILEDGILRLLAAGNLSAAERRLHNMIAAAADDYDAELVMMTCSAVPKGTLQALRDEAGVPLLKIDEPMARFAVAAGSRIGVAVTFPPTRETTHRLLLDAAEEASTKIHISDEVLPLAYRALLAGDLETHDALLLAAVDRLAESGAEAIVLAQVSMARVLFKARERVSVPVLTSLDSSLDAIREILYLETLQVQ